MLAQRRKMPNILTDGDAEVIRLFGEE